MKGSAVSELTRAFPAFREALSRDRPEVVLLMHGVNDLNGAQDGRVQSAGGRRGGYWSNKRATAAARRLSRPCRRWAPVAKAGCPECVAPYNDLIRRMVAARGATLVDVHAAWGGRAGLMGADGIHPTEAGYEVIAAAFFDAIRRTLESPAAEQ